MKSVVVRRAAHVRRGDPAFEPTVSYLDESGESVERPIGRGKRGTADRLVRWLVEFLALETTVIRDRDDREETPT